MITQRNVSPGDYLQPGGGTNGRPLFVLEQTDPVRVFVGVPELASFFIHEHDTALIRFQALAGATREGKVVRSGFSLNPSTRTLQTEIDIPNSDGHLHPGWYVTVTITIDRKQVWTLPSNAIGFQGQQNYYVYLQVDGKPVRTPVIIGPSDDTHTQVLRKYSPVSNTNDWPLVRRHGECPGGQPRRPRRRGSRRPRRVDSTERSSSMPAAPAPGLSAGACGVGTPRGRARTGRPRREARFVAGSLSRILSRRRRATEPPRMIISLGYRFPGTSSDLPGSR